MKAFITEIERGSTVDGPGIRTVVFLKGCPLHCLWCHNPETIRKEAEILRDLKRCTGCGLCRRVPAERAARECPSHAAELAGRTLEWKEFCAVILRDRWMFCNGGGVTFSGGEPLLQAEWVAGAARFCREQGIHSALDTTLAVPWESVAAVLDFIDLFLVDLKHWDSIEHRRLTGAGNEEILRNLHRLDRAGKRILTRTPLIPGLTDSAGCIDGILAIAGTIRNLVRSEFLPCNPLTPVKYERLGRRFPLDIRRESDFSTILKQLNASGIPTLLAI